MRVVVPIPLPNKANTYGIHFSPFFWDAIKDIVAGIRRHSNKPLYWIAPSQEVRDIETAIAYIAKSSLLEDTDKPVRLEIWISDKLDVDAIKAIPDGIQKSGRIKNDRQIQELIVHKIPIKNVEFKFDITII
jgi:Holliday junction resolvase RusA-like endonuclease